MEIVFSTCCGHGGPRGKSNRPLLLYNNRLISMKVTDHFLTLLEKNANRECLNGMVSDKI